LSKSTPAGLRVGDALFALLRDLLRTGESGWDAEKIPGGNIELFCDWYAAAIYQDLCPLLNEYGNPKLPADEAKGLAFQLMEHVLQRRAESVVRGDLDLVDVLPVERLLMFTAAAKISEPGRRVRLVASLARASERIQQRRAARQPRGGVARDVERIWRELDAAGAPSRGRAKTISQRLPVGPDAVRKIIRKTKPAPK
jgi:hypothetical protein